MNQLQVTHLNVPSSCNKTLLLGPETFFNILSFLFFIFLINQCFWPPFKSGLQSHINIWPHIKIQHQLWQAVFNNFENRGFFFSHFLKSNSVGRIRFPPNSKGVVLVTLHFGTSAEFYWRWFYTCCQRISEIKAAFTELTHANVNGSLTYTSYKLVSLQSEV